MKFNFDQFRKTKEEIEQEAQNKEEESKQAEVDINRPEIEKHFQEERFEKMIDEDKDKDNTFSWFRTALEQIENQFRNFDQLELNGLEKFIENIDKVNVELCNLEDAPKAQDLKADLESKKQQALEKLNSLETFKEAA